jgi:hypothetical protein
MRLKDHKIYYVANKVKIFTGIFPQRGVSMRVASNNIEDGRILTGLLNLLGGGSSTVPSVEVEGVKSPQITPGCDFYQNVDEGQQFYIYSPNYPNTFAPNTACRW